MGMADVLILDKKYTGVDEVANNLLLNFNYYLSENLYAGYDFSIRFNIKLDEFKILKSVYRYFSNKDRIKNFVFWVKFNPYSDHPKKMVKLLIKVFNHYANHFKKVIDCNKVQSYLQTPMDKVLFFRFDEWITTIYFDGVFSFRHYNKFNSIAYD